MQISLGCDKFTDRVAPFALLAASKRVATLPRNQIGVGKTFDNRAVGPVVALAMVGEMREGVAHIGQFGNPAVKFRDVFQRDLFHLGTRARAIVPQRQ